MSEIKSDKLSPVTATTTTFGDSGDKLLFTTGTNLDMNGVELILDADADTSITADTDDQIDIRIAGADDFRFTANNFNVLSGSTLTIDSGATITNSGTATGFTSAKLEASADTAAGDNSAMGYTAAEGLILTGQGSTDDITIKNDADTTVVNVATGATDVEISAGNILFGTGSKGVYLGVTSATAANLLDDYEEGTFTAVFRFGGPSGTDNGDCSGSSTYTKVGRMVNFKIGISLDSSISGSGQATVTGLPFSAGASVSGPVAMLFNDRIDASDAPSNIVSGGSDAIYLYVQPSGTGDTLAGMTEAHFGTGAGKAIYLMGTYSV